MEDTVDRPDKKKYKPPTISDWGTIADLTKTGGTHAGGDAKSGSVASQGQ
jgi:hypothetical protein